MEEVGISGESARPNRYGECDPHHDSENHNTKEDRPEPDWISLGAISKDSIILSV